MLILQQLYLYCCHYGLNCKSLKLCFFKAEIKNQPFLSTIKNNCILNSPNNYQKGPLTKLEANIKYHITYILNNLTTNSNEVYNIFCQQKPPSVIISDILFYHLGKVKLRGSVVVYKGKNSITLSF